MCGILGAVAYDHNRVEPERFAQALNKISYRGPDHTGSLFRGGVALGHKRLAIVDLDARSNQPFVSEDDQVALIFNGEIYNYVELRKSLVAEGCNFRTQSDTEVIVRGYERWGTSFVTKLKGMFAICLADFRKGEIIVARDRMGEKPLFFTVCEGKLMIASEMKAILSLLSRKPSADPTAIIDFLVYGFVPNPKTIFQGIEKLRPGELAVFSMYEPGMIRRELYFEVRNHIRINSDRSYDQLKEEFFSIIEGVSKQVSSCDVPYGAFLSGGVDSSIACWALKNVDKTVRTYTIGFPEKEFDEREYSTRVADHLGLQNVQREVSFDGISKLYGELVTMFDEPFNDVSFVPTYYVSKESRQFNSVVISGDGADELFGGYVRYPKMVRLAKLQKRFGAFCRLARPLAAVLRDENDLKRQIYRVGLSEDDLFPDLMAINFKRRELDAILGPGLKAELKHYDPYHHVRKYLAEIPADYSYVQKLRYLDLKLTLPDDMLVKVDRMSMLNSLEVRPLFLHADVVEFALKLPDEWIATADTAKVFLKKALEGILPTDILYRRKMGFAMPFGNWVKRELHEQFAAAVMSIPDSLINRSRVNAVYALHAKGKRDFSSQLHSMMALGSWV
jgi:asparagine synthase (glutamine-hydrolysing)